MWLSVGKPSSTTSCESQGDVGGPYILVPRHLLLCAGVKGTASKTQTGWSVDYSLWAQLILLQAKQEPLSGSRCSQSAERHLCQQILIHKIALE